VFPGTDNFYAQWRLHGCGVPIFSEDRESPPERLLQAIWQHQRLLRTRLKTTDGRMLRVLHPGFLNREGGPDFRGAVVQFNDEPPRSGDIEVDIHTVGWHAHRHDRNPAFQNVVLHVIWESDQPAVETPPRLALRRILDAPVGELSLWLDSDAVDTLPESLRGRCGAPLKELPEASLTELLLAAGQIRFQGKAAQLRARARQIGWEQALWEGLFRALGYKHNAWAMQCLADQRERWLADQDTTLSLQARLLGISNLLPADLPRKPNGTANYLRRVWDQWWREREQFADCLLPRALWRFSGQRPANHPQRRIALAAHWLASGDLPQRIERWCAESVKDRVLASSLLELLQAGKDDFWSWHWTLHSTRLSRAQPLLGTGRVTDLAVNVVLPWLWIRALEGRNQKLQEIIQRRFDVWPAAADNAVLRLARQRLLGSVSSRSLRTAAEQQGLMQIVRDFCDHSNAVCEHCRFPELVRGWRGERVDQP
jgi:hypothetical protein